MLWPQSDGNGNYTISKTSTITLGLAMALLTILVGITSYSAAQSQQIADHICDRNVHWDKCTLDAAYVPRPEMASELRSIQKQLDRIEKLLTELSAS